MKTNEDSSSEVEVLTALIEHQRHLSRIDDLADQYQTRARAARQFLAEKALITQHLKEGSTCALTQAEVGAQHLAERFLGSK
jgi:hypothetical protein